MKKMLSTMLILGAVVTSLSFGGCATRQQTFESLTFPESGLARPAFNNEVAYDLAESIILGYKGARIGVIEATNTEITNKVLSRFE